MRARSGTRCRDAAATPARGPRRPGSSAYSPHRRRGRRRRRRGPRLGSRPAAGALALIAHQLPMDQSVIRIVHDQLARAPARRAHVCDSSRLIQRHAGDRLGLVGQLDLPSSAWAEVHAHFPPHGNPPRACCSASPDIVSLPFHGVALRHRRGRVERRRGPRQSARPHRVRATERPTTGTRSLSQTHFSDRQFKEDQTSTSRQQSGWLAT